MKIKIIIFLFLAFGWRKKLDEWKYKGSNFFLFDWKERGIKILCVKISFIPSYTNM